MSYLTCLSTPGLSQEDEVLARRDIEANVFQGEAIVSIYLIGKFLHPEHAHQILSDIRRRNEGRATPAMRIIRMATASATSIRPTDASRYTVVGRTSVWNRFRE